MTDRQHTFLWAFVATISIGLTMMVVHSLVQHTKATQQQLIQCKQDVLGLFDEVAQVKDPNNVEDVNDAELFKQYKPELINDLNKFSGERGLKHCQLTYWANTYQYE